MKQAEVVESLQRKNIFRGTVKKKYLEPPPLSALIDRVRDAVEHPERYGPVYLDHVIEDWLNVLDCLIRMGRALPVALELSRREEAKRKKKRSRSRER